MKMASVPQSVPHLDNIDDCRSSSDVNTDEYAAVKYLTEMMLL